MNNRKQYILVLTLVWLVTLLPSFYYLYMQSREDKIVDQYLSSHNLTGLPNSRQSAIRVSAQIRNDFNTDESSFVALDLKNRPFLREDVGFLITHKEGVCGEGTRVIVRLLNRLGFDASRITLYDRRLHPKHTLVSVLIDEQEFFVDSINSLTKTTELLEKKNISSKDFNLSHYSDDVAKRRELKKAEFVRTDLNGMTEGYNRFFDKYRLYSYEATPYSKLLTKIGLDLRVFNLERPNRWISDLAEKPNMIMFFATSFLSMIVIFLLHKLKIVRFVLRKITA